MVGMALQLPFRAAQALRRDAPAVSRPIEAAIDVVQQAERLGNR